MNDTNDTLKYRVGELEKSVDSLDGKIDKLLTNDLPHIQRELSKLGTKIGVLTAVNIGALIIAIVISQWLK